MKFWNRLTPKMVSRKLQIFNFILETSGQEYPVVIGGDFNTLVTGKG
jgi:hypothetical protein